MKWKVGDRVYDSSSDNHFTGLGTVCRIRINPSTMDIKRDKDGKETHTNISDPDIIPEEIYNSSLYKALKE